MINICLVINALNFGGVEKVIETYLKDYDQTQYRIDIIAQDNSNKEHIQYFESLGFNVFLVTHKKKGIIKNITEIYKIIKKGKYDILHSHMSYTNFYVLLLGQLMGIKIRINHYHNVFQEKGAKKLIIWICNRLCDFFCTSNMFCSDAVQEYFGHTVHSVKILYNIIDIEKFEFNITIREKLRSKFLIDNNTIVIGHIGRFTDQKNHIFLLKLFFDYHNLYPNSKLLLCGDGPLLKVIEAKCKKMNIQNNVIFLGAVTNPEIYYNMMDVFLFPSKFEGLGMTFLEAQINGIVSLGSDILPKEVIVSQNIKLISLQDNLQNWIKYIPTSVRNCSIHNTNYFYKKCSRYDLRIHKEDLFIYYQELIKIENKGILK